MRNRWFFLGLALLALCLFVPQESFAQSTVSCNSDDGNRHTCAVDTWGGVTLATQHSNSACTQGYSWGYDNQSIWVDHGCRANFTVGSSRDYHQRGRNGQYGRNGQDDRDRQDNGQTQTITCSSDDMRRHSCAADTRGGVTLARQLSNAACTQGHSWGYDNRRIWVDHGCRADFTVGSSRGYHQRGRNGQHGRNGQDDRDRQDNGQTQTISCSSDDMRRHSCAANTRGGVTLARQLSNAACTQGYSWGYDNQGIWVDHGCRADFNVSVRDNTDNQR